MILVAPLPPRNLNCSPPKTGRAEKAAQEAGALYQSLWRGLGHSRAPTGALSGADSDQARRLWAVPASGGPPRKSSSEAVSGDDFQGQPRSPGCSRLPWVSIAEMLQVTRQATCWSHYPETLLFSSQSDQKLCKAPQFLQEKPSVPLSGFHGPSRSGPTPFQLGLPCFSTVPQAFVWALA